MGLDADDPIPDGISATDAYAKIRSWYQANVSIVEARGDEYGEKSAELIRSLGSPGSVSEEKMQEVFDEVQTGLLEWAYHQSDGDYKMGAYAIAASE